MAKKQTEGAEEPKKVYDVRVKPGHPTGAYRRAGLVFSVHDAVRLDEVPDEIRTDPWLIVTEAEA